MNDFIKKTVIINRAVPGSGKTTISNCIINYLQEKGISVNICSTDDFFMTNDGRYVFQIEKLYCFHQQNIKNFIDSLKSGTEVVICDNINIAPWQTRPYTDAARKYNYQIILINFSPRELDKHIESQKVTLQKPDAHGVPKEVLIRFIQEYNIFNPLIDRSVPIDPDIHKDYYWDPKNNVRLVSGKLSSHFDVDHVIEIMPDHYHQKKKEIGEDIYNLLK